MKRFILFAIFVAAAAAMPFEVAEDPEGEQYYLVPVSREKRDTTWGVSGTGASIGHQGTLFNSNNHRLDGSAYAAKNFASHGLRPDQVGGRLDYSHKPSSSGAFVAADNARGYGTDLSAGAKYNIYQNKNLGVDLTGQYGRHYGGPFGTGHSSSGVFLKAHGTF